MNNKNRHATGASKPRAKDTKPSETQHMTECHSLLDGDLKVFRTTKSGNRWQMGFWIKEEKKAYRKSLGTRNLDEAKELAKKRFYQLQHDLQRGNKLFSKTMQQLVEDFYCLRAKA